MKLLFRLSVILIALLVIVFGISLSRNLDSNMAKAISVYTISIESESKFNPNASTSLQENGAIGNVLILINDNPVSFFSWGTNIMEINQYLKPGKNTITLKGEHQRHLWIEVSLYEKKNVETFQQQKRVATVLEETVVLQGQTHQWQGSFEVDILYELPIFEQSNKIPEDKIHAKKEILSFLQENHNDFRKFNILEIKKLSREGCAVWLKLAYKQSEDEIERMFNVGYEIIKKYEYPPFEEDSIRLVFGSNLVMAYAGFDGPLSSPYIWPVVVNEDITYSPPVILAFFNNKWVWWSQ